MQSGLTFCNRCGQRVVADSERAQVAESLSSSVGFVAGFGFIGFIFVALVLVKNGVPGSEIVPIAFCYFGALLGICFLILRQTQLLSKNDKPSARYDTPIENESAAYLRPVTTAQLATPTDGPASVTEHTTKTLEGVRVERR